MKVKIDFQAWEPCEACKSGFSATAEEYHATELAFSPEDKPPTIGAYGDDWIEVEIAYCPKCGRPLTEQARKLFQEKIEKLSTPAP